MAICPECCETIDFLYIEITSSAFTHKLQADGTIIDMFPIEEETEKADFVCPNCFLVITQDRDKATYFLTLPNTQAGLAKWLMHSDTECQSKSKRT